MDLVHRRLAGSLDEQQVDLHVGLPTGHPNRNLLPKMHSRIGCRRRSSLPTPPRRVPFETDLT